MLNKICLFCDKTFKYNNKRGKTPSFCSAKCRDTYRMTKNISIREIELLKKRRWLEIENKRSDIGLETPKNISIKPMGPPSKSKTKIELDMLESQINSGFKHNAPKPCKETVRETKTVLKTNTPKKKSLLPILIPAMGFFFGAVWASCLANSEGAIQAFISIPFITLALIADVSRVPMVWISILAIVITRMVTSRLGKTDKNG